MKKPCCLFSIALAVFLVSASVPAWPQFLLSRQTASVEAVTETSGVHPGEVARMAVVVKLGLGWHVNAHQPRDPNLIPTAVAVQPLEGFTVRNVAYPEPTTVTLEGTSEALLVYSNTFPIGLEVAVAPTVQPGSYTLQATLRYQACDNKQCLPPESASVSIPVTVVAAGQAVSTQHPDIFQSIHFGTGSPTPEPVSTPVAAPTGAAAEDWQEAARDFTVTGEATGYLKSREFTAFLDRVEAGQGHTANPLANKGLWFTIAFVVGGGLLLNLTPCVLPLIPVNLAIIGAGAKAKSRWRGFALGAAYGVGITLTYGILGLAVIVGAAKTFGVINSTPWFNAAVAIVFLALALAMFDVFLIDFTRFQTLFGIKRKEGGSVFVALAMGIVAALLAGACVAPVIISTIVYAQGEYARGDTFALALPFLVGLGMALPWPFAGAGLSFLPKPGKWMERIKYAFGVIILVLAGYYGYLAYSLFSDRYLVDREAVRASAQQLNEEGWIPSFAQGLAQARREHKPVIVDFWATWCKNCLAMNDTTFKDPAVVARLNNYVKIKYQAEDPNDPATRAVMDQFHVLGLPTYITLQPRS